MSVKDEVMNRSELVGEYKWMARNISSIASEVFGDKVNNDPVIRSIAVQLHASDSPYNSVRILLGAICTMREQDLKEEDREMGAHKNSMYPDW